MNCPNCGNPLSNQAYFCARCGSPVRQCRVQTQRQAPPVCQAPRQERNQHPGVGFSAGRQVTPNIVLGSDGKFRWVYEMSLFRNPTVFLTVWKIFIFVALGIFVLLLLINLAEGYLDGETLLSFLMFFGIALAGITALVGISYLIYAAIMGGKYIVLFEMDDNGINHAQVPSQARKARGISSSAFTIGLLTGNHSAFIGGMAAANTSMYTGFSQTRKVRFYPNRDLIKIRQLLFRNQIYAKPEDFAFVQSYILARVPDQAKPKHFRQQIR